MVERTKVPPAFRILSGSGPFVAVAVHAGHAVRDEPARLMRVTPEERLREEDPFTDRWTGIGDWEIVGLRSRFEVDLNRPREKAVYLSSEDAWGLEVWKRPPSADLLGRSLREYDAFYELVDRLFHHLVREYGRFLVLDLHSYNHRRAGPEAPDADPRAHPDVNVGTGTMDRVRWHREVVRFMEGLRSFELDGRALDVRENVRFQGGFFARWTHSRFRAAGCVLSVDVKKIYMDEWTGQVDGRELDRIGKALDHAVTGLRELWRHG